jgi:hypothetical protein
MNNPMNIHQVTITIHAEANDYLPHITPDIEWSVENPTRTLLLVTDETEPMWEHSITSVLAEDDTCTSALVGSITLCIESHLSESELWAFLNNNLYAHIEEDVADGWVESQNVYVDVITGII